MTSNGPSSARLRFDTFEVDLRTGELWRHGIKIRLPEQSFRVLQVLIERPGEMVTRDELKQILWPADTFVDFDHGVNSAVKRIRDVLGDSAERPLYVETIPKRGYRFVGPPVVPVGVKPAQPPAASVPGSPSKPRVEIAVLRPGFKRMRYVALVFLALALLLGTFAARPWRARPTAPSLAPHIESLVVIPLSNFSNDPDQDYFTDGMTEALIANLAQVRALRVISRTSAMHYKGTNKTLPEIARELNVDAVIEGAVQRSGNRVRVTAQLIQGQTDVHLWAKTYERDSQDVLVMQSEIAEAIAGEVKVRLTAQEQQQLSSARTINPDAYNAYLLGNFHAAKRNPASIAKAIDYFEQAIRIDASYAPAYAALANTYFEQEIWGGLGLGKMQSQVRANTLRALELNNDLADVHLLLAQIYYRYDWDWQRAESEFQRAIELNANLAASYTYYAFFLQSMGRQKEALAAAHHAVELDPLSPAYLSDEGRILFRARQYESAVARYRRALELDPGYIPALTRMADAYTIMGKYDDALACIQKLHRVTGDSRTGSLTLLELYAHTGKQHEALAGLTAMRNDDPLDSLGVASVYGALGDRDRAIDVLEKALDTRSIFAFTFVDPRLDPLRSNARFQQLLRRAHLPS